MSDVTFRPLDVWPGKMIAASRPSPFRAGWGVTLRQLEHELDRLDARHVVVQLALEERDIRRDGWPRAHARPSHPGVVVAFESMYGPLKYATAEFQTWQDNLRAIALGLEALRKVDRYGITRRGEQYTGWKQLTAGPATIDAAQARRVLDEWGGDWRRALKATHPDHGGDAERFELVQAARKALEAADA